MVGGEAELHFAHGTQPSADSSLPDTSLPVAPKTVYPDNSGFGVSQVSFGFATKQTLGQKPPAANHDATVAELPSEQTSAQGNGVPASAENDGHERTLGLDDQVARVSVAERTLGLPGEAAADLHEHTLGLPGEETPPRAGAEQTLGLPGEIDAGVAADAQTLGLPGAATPGPEAHDQTLGLPPDTEVNDQTLGLPGEAAGARPPHEATLEVPLEPVPTRDVGDQTLGLPSQAPSLDDNATVGRADQRAEETFARGGPRTTGPLRPPRDQTVDLAPAPAPAPKAADSQPGTVRDKTTPEQQRTSPTRLARPRRKDPLKSVNVPGYEILGVLGRGGMGVVYKARHLRLNRMVALKMILSGAHAGEAELARFLIEAKAIAQLQHPNIVAIYEIAEHDGKPFFSLEYLDGGSLQGKMNGVPLPPREAAQMVETLARAVNFAHEKGIIHRDLKPANVLLTSAGAPKLTDFGLAKNIDAQDSGNTGTEAVLGTPSYMAPEQAAGKTREMGPPGDIYSLGAVLYDLITGRPPFRGTTVLDTLQQVQKAEPVAPARLVPAIPIDLQTICLKCLEKDPARRYATARALADDLQRYLQGVPIQARPTPAWERANKWVRRNPWPASAMAGALVVVMAFIGALLYHVHETDLLNADLAERRQVAEDKQVEAENARVDAEKARDAEAIERQKAVKAEKAAKEAEKTARDAEGQAKASEEVTSQAFSQVQGSVEQLLVLAEKKLRITPRAAKVRQELLNEAVAMTRYFTADRRENLDVKWRSARALRYNADVFELLGKSEAAHQKFQEAAALYQELIAKARLSRPDVFPELQKQLLETLINHCGVAAKVDEKAAGQLLPQVDELLTIVLAAEPDSETFRSYAAAFRNNQGIYQYRHGDVAGALASFEDAEKILSKLTGDRKYSNQQKHWLHLARTEINRGALWTAEQERPGSDSKAAYAKARKAYEKAITQLESVVFLVKEPEYANELGRAFVNLGALLHNNREKYDELFVRALKVLGALVKHSPEVPDYHHLHAMAAVSWGNHMLSDRRMQESIELFTKARQTLERLVLDFPDMDDYQFELARASNGLGHAAALVKAASVAKGELDGRESLERSRKLLHELLGRHPEREEYQRDLDDVTRNLITYHALERKRQDALHSWERAEAHHKKAAEYQTERASVHAERAATAVERQDHERAAAALRKVFEFAPERWAKIPHALRLYARCVALAEADERLAAELRERQARAYAKETLEQLRAAVGRGVAGLPELLKSADLDRLRASPDIGRQLKQIEALLDARQAS